MRSAGAALPVVVVATLLLVGLAGCQAPAPPPAPEAAAPSSVPDPTQPGPLAWERADYDFGHLLVDDSEVAVYRYTVPVRGSVHAPDGPGPFPLLLFMHGRHGTCAVGGLEVIFTGVCPNATVVEPVDSFRGYDYLASNLASHGYVVASIDANTINDRDLAGDSGANARGRLVLHTIDQFGSVNATGRSLPDAADLPTGLTVLPRTEVPHLQGRIDLSRIGLMGHSRGGEGVARAAHMDLEAGSPHGLDGVFALAPTDFARWPVAGVALATLLPYCDGDVSNLQGAWMYDDARRLEPAAPRYQVLAMGANHNFYNTKWTGDDWGTLGEWCGSEQGDGRDSAESQRAHGLGLMASFFRLAVGGEQAFAPAWEGAAPWPATLCPEHEGCADRLRVAFMPTPERRQDLAQDGTPSDRTLDVQACAPADCPSQPTIGAARQTAWDCADGGLATFDLPQDVAGFRAVSLRVGGAVDGGAVTLSARLFGGYGYLELGSRTIAAPPGEEADPGAFGAEAKTVLSDLRFGWPDATEDDLAGKRLLEVSCSGDGSIQVADVLLVR